MKASKSDLPPQRRRLVKGLTMVCCFTLLTSFAFALWSSLTGDYTTVLEYDDIAAIQLEEPEAGTPAAIMHTTAGDMTYTLYPAECPETVANFIALAESGYYDGTYVFRVEQDIFFSAGAPDASGELESGALKSAQEHVPQELSARLWPFRGALCAMTTTAEGGFWKRLTKTQEYYTGSRFLVANSIEMTDAIREGLQASGNDAMTMIAEKFLEQGGIPNFSQQICVFGQLIEGYEVLDAITGAELTGEEGSMRPAEDIVITGIEITEIPSIS